MRFFTLLLDPQGQGIPEETLNPYEAMPKRRGLEYAWHRFDGAALLAAWDDPYGEPLSVQEGQHLAVGIVRLDNRKDLERWAECKGGQLSDLGVVLRVVARHGTKYIRDMLGDFGFVVWDNVRRSGVAATDAFAARPLFYAECRGLLAWSSRAEPLAAAEQYEPRYLVELLASYTAPRDLSVFAGVRTVPAASFARYTHDDVCVQEYWSPHDTEVQHRWAGNEQQAVETCRELLIESTRMRMSGAGEIWGQLSGGLDSSSVVSMAAWLREQGRISRSLGGTITYVDRQGTQTDEREYSETVVRRYAVRNVAIVDPPMWYDEEFPPIAPDQPGLDFHVQPRELRLLRVIREAGGRVLLTGYGGDEVFGSNTLFLADWVARGRLLPTARSAVQLAAAQRASVWELAYNSIVLPLLPGTVRRRLIRDESPPAPWLNPHAVRRYAQASGAAVLHRADGRLTRKHRHAIASGVQSLQGVVHGGVLSDVLELRHPLLHRPLVDFALAIPDSMRAESVVSRWLLRGAVAGILPDKVRARVGKPDTGEALIRSLPSRRAHLRQLLDQPVLADLGLIDGRKLRAAFDALSVPGAGIVADHIALFPTLAVEAWLQIRSGRWPLCDQLSCNRRTTFVDSPGKRESEPETEKMHTAVQPTP